jgi:L,D-peptidoglycan transpeptidase YkuD (ErfK/YbiS/YcfS/YnhG family)
MSVSSSRITGAALALLTAAGVTACGSTAAGIAGKPYDRPAHVAGSGSTAHGGRAGRSAPVPEPRVLPGLGPKTLKQVPADARQAVVVRGEGRNSSRSTVVLYRRTDTGHAEGWKAIGPPWPAHNALRGWTDDHRAGDLRSPIGVFGLTDAGGLLPDPGSKLPYRRSTAFTIQGTGFKGESLAGSFDHVVAINYNRVPGTSPLDWTRPLGDERGGGIWIHVDHGGPTHGCVSLSEAAMKQLLRTLDPARHPVVVMGDAAALAR